MEGTRELQLAKAKTGDQRSLAKLISLVENKLPGSDELLANLNFDKNIPVIGITGPPGAGKSSLLNALLTKISKDKKVAVIAVDPTSPFNYGSLLGDRVRMAEHFSNPNIFIRSMATRGNLGGLSPRIFEVVDLIRNMDFDYIFIETVGVGQSEVEIAGLADTTVLVLVPEAGDEIQTIKSGVMEIADIYIVNKSDRVGAESFVKNLHYMVHSRDNTGWEPPVIKTIATQNTGMDELLLAIDQHSKSNQVTDKKAQLLTEKALLYIGQHRMKDIKREEILAEISKSVDDKNFNLYRFVKQWY